MDHRTIDEFLDGVVDVAGERLLFDARHLRWIDPNGMLALLVAGTVAARGQEGRPKLQLPESADVGGYLGRMGFQAAAQEIFDFEATPRRGAGGPSDVLLEITSVAANSDVHKVVEGIHGGAGAFLVSKLG